MVGIRGVLVKLAAFRACTRSKPCATSLCRPAVSHGARSNRSAPRKRPCCATTAHGGIAGNGGFGSGNGGSGGAGGGDGWGDASENNNSPLPLGAVLAVSALDWAASRPAAGRHQQRRPARVIGLKGAAALGAGLAAAVAASAAAAAAADGSSSGKCSVAGAPAEPPAGIAVLAAAKQEPNAADSTTGPPPTAPPPPPKRIVLFIEPSPFTYTSGYQTRFRATIREMVAQGCAVLVVTPGKQLHGAWLLAVGCSNLEWDLGWGRGWAERSRTRRPWLCHCHFN